jgi:signal transduction histidine kinase
VCIQRDYVNEERLYIFANSEAGVNRSLVKPFDAYLRARPSDEQLGTFFKLGQSPRVILSDMIDDRQDNKVFSSFLWATLNISKSLSSIGANDRSGIQYCMIFSPRSEVHGVVDQSLITIVQTILQNRYTNDFEIANQFSAMRHELRPLLRDVRNRFAHVLKSFVTPPYNRKERSDYDDTVLDIESDLTKSVELLDVFGFAENFSAIPDPVLVTAEQRAKNKSEEVALIPLLHRVRKQIDPKYRGYTRLVLPKGISLFVRADIENLVSILSKLVDNAQKYSPDNRSKFGNPEIVVNAEASVLAIIIGNIGPQLQKHEISELFSKQFRGRGARRLPVPGTGIGLYHAKRIAEFEGLSLEYIQHADSGRDSTRALTKHQFAVLFPPALWRRVDLEGRDT